jgi:hypothetical protein
MPHVERRRRGGTTRRGGASERGSSGATRSATSARHRPRRSITSSPCASGRISGSSRATADRSARATTVRAPLASNRSGGRGGSNLQSPRHETARAGSLARPQVFQGGPGAIAARRFGFHVHQCYGRSWWVVGDQSPSHRHSTSSTAVPVIGAGTATSRSHRSARRHVQRGFVGIQRLEQSGTPRRRA